MKKLEGDGQQETAVNRRVALDHKLPTATEDPKENEPDQVSRVSVSQQQQQQRGGGGEQLSAGAVQRSAEHGPLSEEAQLVGDLVEQRGR